MKNTTSTKTIWIFVVLLVLGFIFWRWSLLYRATPTIRLEQMMTTPSSNEDLEKELEASMNSNSEIELRAVDGEF